MLKNNNQKAVKRLSERSLRQNRIRNIFVILAIVLTTFMFTTVFGIGFSVAQNTNVMWLRKQGTKSTVWLKQPSKGQIGQVKKAASLNAAGIEIPAGEFTDSSGKAKVALGYYNSTEWEENFTPAVSDIVGDYPQKEKEIMLSKAALAYLDIEKPEKGMEISLQKGKEINVFSLSGWYTDYAYATGEFHGFVSKAYVDALGLTVEQDGILCLSAKAGKQSRLLEELLAVSLRNGQEFESTYDTQDETKDTIGIMIAMVGIMGGVILLSGYLLIYNVMYISVAKDIRFYGMLKTIGASSSQIRKLVKMQSTKLSLFGIPIGILLGVLASFVIVPFALQMFASSGGTSVMPTEISFHPLIYAGTILFAMLTVAVSCRKPAKLAGKVSPAEALRYNGQDSAKVRAKKSTDGGKLYKMAFRNVFREKKRAFLVLASLFMGTMSFLAVDAFLGSIRLENFVDFYLPNDYTVFTTGETKGIEALAEEISHIQGVSSVDINYAANAVLNPEEEVLQPFLEKAFPEKKERQEAIANYKKAPNQEENGFTAPVVAVSKRMIEKYNERAEKKVDIARFEEGEVCVLDSLLEKGEVQKAAGKMITMTDVSSKKELTIEVAACAALEENGVFNIGYYWNTEGAPECILISKKAMDRFCKETHINNVIVDCEPESEGYVTKKMKENVMVNPCVRTLEVKSETIEGFYSSMKAMNVVGGGISFVLILIGMANFVNVMLTGVYIRRNELAVMESVGMTKKQVKKMLVFEGSYYGILTLALILTVGNVMIKLITDMSRQIADYAVAYYPAALLAVTAVVIMAACIIVPVILYHMISKESITERIRQAN